MSGPGTGSGGAAGGPSGLTDDPLASEPAWPPLRARIQAFVRAPALDEAEAESLAEAIAEFLDGASVVVFEATLGALREVGAYPVSIRVLQRAWGGTLPDRTAGAVAQDLIGTLLHGMGARDAAIEAAREITEDVLARGGQLAGDLGDLLLSWQLYEVAEPLVTFAAERMPGDAGFQFNLGVVQKRRGDWTGCRETFERVQAEKPSQAGAWNLGIACTALRDWPAARAAWTAVGFDMPPGDGDIARPGERLPVKLPTRAGSEAAAEIIWGERLCPARMRLLQAPRYTDVAAFGDVILVDGVAEGEVQGPDGQPIPVLPHLGPFESWGGHTIPLTGPRHPEAAAFVEALRAGGLIATPWADRELVAVGLVLRPGSNPEAARAIVEAAMADTGVKVNLSGFDEV